MRHVIRTVPVAVVIIEIIFVVNDSSVVITVTAPMIIVMIRSINAYGHYCKKSKIRRIISVIIRWRIGNICR